MKTWTSVSISILVVALVLRGKAVDAEPESERPTKVFEMDCATSPDYDGKIRYDACGPELQTEIDAVIRDFMCPDDDTNSTIAVKTYLDDTEKAIWAEYKLKREELKKKQNDSDEEKKNLLRSIKKAKADQAILQQIIDSINEKILEAMEDDDLKDRLKAELKETAKHLEEDFKEKEEEVKKANEHLKDIEKKLEELQKEIDELRQELLDQLRLDPDEIDEDESDEEETDGDRRLYEGGFKYKYWCDHMCWGWMPNSCSIAYPVSVGSPYLQYL